MEGFLLEAKKSAAKFERPALSAVAVRQPPKPASTYQRVALTNARPWL
jgi:hypothetical protein